MIATRKELDELLRGQHGHPHGFLGMHPLTHHGRAGVVVRAFVQDAVTCEVVDYSHDPELRYPMEKLDPMGLFETFNPDRKEVLRYRLPGPKPCGAGLPGSFHPKGPDCCWKQPRPFPDPPLPRA